MHILAIKKSVFFYLKIAFSKKKLPLTGNVLRGLKIRPRLSQYGEDRSEPVRNHKIRSGPRWRT